MTSDAAHGTQARPAWLGVDWGTTNLRVWVMSEEAEVLAALASPQGMSGLAADQYEDVLVGLVADHLHDADQDHPIPVVVCGMAGSRSGWSDAGYIDVPANAGALSGSMISVATKDKRISVHILSGLRQVEPADVMRGEETQLAGFAASNPGFAGHVCLPGTHAKWVEFHAGRIASSQTVMTGEIFDLISKNSILRLSVASPDEIDGALPTGAFLEGIEGGYGERGGALGRLFRLRAEDLVGDGRTREQRLAYLSGLLIGTEFATVAPSADKPIIFIGSGKLGPLYRRAARHLGFEADCESGDDLVLRGLQRAYEALNFREASDKQQVAQ